MSICSVLFWQNPDHWAALIFAPQATGLSWWTGTIGYLFLHARIIWLPFGWLVNAGILIFSRKILHSGLPVRLHVAGCLIIQLVIKMPDFLKCCGGTRQGRCAVAWIGRVNHRRKVGAAPCVVIRLRSSAAAPNPP